MTNIFISYWSNLYGDRGCTLINTRSKNTAINRITSRGVFDDTLIEKLLKSSGAHYKFTIVEKEIGDGWFCTEKETVSAGFTRALICRK